jgi:hypothetical protein
LKNVLNSVESLSLSLFDRSHEKNPGIPMDEIPASETPRRNHPFPPKASWHLDWTAHKKAGFLVLLLMMGLPSGKLTVGP